jgi:hypothetical protein
MCDIGFVYKWTDSSNNKWYIGSHTGHPKDGYVGGGHLFKKAYKKRKESFSREILYFGYNHRELEEFILEELDAMNDKMSYNLTNSWRGVVRHTEESKKKMSKSRKGIPVSDETRKKLSDAKKGEKHPQWGKKGYWFGKKLPKESVRKTQLKRSYRVYCEHNGKTYDCTMDAANDLKMSKSGLLNMINGHRPNRYGLIKI